ncbi:hypothetical protein [Acidianus ambivalens]|uniref:Uncharacterized protein n=1 Tax=Acidianus ambivalens TaxID=2283 RepID=A0A650CTN9_ACIAM|nr:hypothetical protein [Acidianus ambivalens]MQL56298.1 hypothetical protein [Acidianus ambivalens]QGR21168.1 hypothetical protein D1866_03465 [Acidianus ambivalens]
MNITLIGEKITSFFTKNNKILIKILRKLIYLGEIGKMCDPSYKKIDEKKLREFKAEAIRRRLTLSEAINQAIDLWLNKVSAEDSEVERERELNKKFLKN